MNCCSRQGRAWFGNCENRGLQENQRDDSGAPAGDRNGICYFKLFSNEPLILTRSQGGHESGNYGPHSPVDA